MIAKPKNISRSAGVYIFRRGGTPLYIGKAANLRQRLTSYFTKAEGRTPKVEKMLGEATRLKIIETSSEIEALIKEAELIKKYRPKYNLLMRDDKSYFYAAVTKESFPRIFITHQPRMQGLGVRGQRSGRHGSALSPTRYPLTPRYIGPFTNGSALRAALKLLRRVFPYCTCITPHKRPCLNSEMGRCPGYCCIIARDANGSQELNKISDRLFYSGIARRRIRTKRQTARDARERREYRKNIRNTLAVLSGDRTRLTGRLKRELTEAVKKERYEEAARLRDALFGLADVFAHRQILHAPEMRYPWPIVLGRLQALLKTRRDIVRIEGYDIANISGTGATGSMVVFVNGLPDKSQYRKFRIRTVAGINDTAMLHETLRRRFGHPEWPHPELVVIDGGKPQLNAARQALRGLPPKNFPHAHDREHAGSFPIITSLAKREETLFVENGRAIAMAQQHPALLHLFQRIRDESHRFARKYHHTLRKRAYAEAA